jgi:hypothetical protein
MCPKLHLSRATIDTTAFKKHTFAFTVSWQVVRLLYTGTLEKKERFAGLT